MARKPKIRLRKGQPAQETAKGLEIPVPTRRNFIHDLRKAAKFDDPSGDGKGSAPKQ
jgi:hypothetical protein